MFNKLLFAFLSLMMQSAGKSYLLPGSDKDID